MRRAPFDRWPHLRAFHGGGSGGRAGGGASDDAPASTSGPLASSGQADTPVGGTSPPAFLDDTQIEDGRNGQPASGGKFALLIQFANQLAFQGKPLFSFIGAKGDPAGGAQPWDDAEGTPLLRQIYCAANYGSIKEGVAIQYEMSTRSDHYAFGTRFNDTSYSVVGPKLPTATPFVYPGDVVTQALTGTRGWGSSSNELAITAQPLDPNVMPNRMGGVLRSGVVWQEPQTMIDASKVGSFIDVNGTQTGKNAYVSLRGVREGLPIVGLRSGSPDSAEALQKLRQSLLNTYQFRRGQIGWCAQAVESDSNFVTLSISPTNYRYIFDQTYGAGGTAHTVSSPAKTLPLTYSSAGLSTQVRCYVFVYARMTGVINTGSIGVANRDASGAMASAASDLTNPITVSGTTWKWYPDKLSATTARFNPATAPYFLGYAGAGYDRVALCGKSTGATNTLQIAAFSIVPMGDGDFSNNLIVPDLPGSALFFFDGDNIDGSHNTTLTDGGTISAWKNLGLMGTSADLAQATAGLRPTFRAIAEAGKLNNRGGVESAGTKFMATATFTIRQIPITWLIVYKNTASGTQVISCGGATNTNQTLTSGATVQMYAGTTQTPAITPVANKWETLILRYEGANSTARLNTTTVSGFGTTGSTGIDALGLFWNPTNTGAASMIGTIACVAGFSSVSPYTAPSDDEIYAWVTAKYGATPQ